MPATWLVQVSNNIRAVIDRNEEQGRRARLYNTLDELAIIHARGLAAGQQLCSDDLHDGRSQQVSVEKLCKQPQCPQLPQLQLAPRLPAALPPQSVSTTLDPTSFRDAIC